MHTTRLEAFSDAVIAIIMTIMVLELKIPHGTDWSTLSPLVPLFLAYVMSFLYLGIYWNNHHHMFHATQHVDGRVLWANMHLLFWLSLVPFATGWMDENHFAALPTALYGIILLLSAISYFIVQQTIIAHHGTNSILKQALGNDWKGKSSMVIYLVAIPLAFVHSWIALTLYALVALMWLVPDSRIERKLTHESHT